MIETSKRKKGVFTSRNVYRGKILQIFFPRISIIIIMVLKCCKIFSKTLLNFEIFFARKLFCNEVFHTINCFFNFLLKSVSSVNMNYWYSSISACKKTEVKINEKIHRKIFCKRFTNL